ncbi:heparinase II/III family protein [Rufibacter sp. H-1]|uniref:Heparinase II/III family protein n=1 Tax=Rufibacter sediminis TaxID=2762756 RepID=A0ABR6VWK4_9BACT|nr:heparinase II/III family protein [Rufibacter sediminis]MBC3541576.1 heparinase II/III family protein [Rufibacter sediminis]
MSYPRTLLKASQVPNVQQAISSGVRYTLYSGVYSNVTGSATTNNTSSNDRRARAAFAKNAAFVALLNRKPSGGTVLQLSETERAAFVSKSKKLLEGINTAVEVYASFSGGTYTEWQWRSKELIDYMVAYDLLRGAGEPVDSLITARAKLQEFAGNLYKQSITPFWGTTFYGTIKNNHTLMTASALGLAAVVLNDVGGTDAWLQPSNWINTGLYHMDNVLWRDANRQSDPNVLTGYAEGPYYFKYAFLNCLPFIRSMGNFLPDVAMNYTYGTTTRSIRNPYFDPSYDLLYDWIYAIQMPDGRFPALEDSYVDMGMPELALTGKSKYLNPMAFTNFSTNQLNSLAKQLKDGTVDMRAAFLASNLAFSTPANPSLTALPHSGNLVFRSDNDTLASYLHVYGKNGLSQKVSGGHNNGDASSFILHAKGQLLALDPGYLSSANRAAVGEGVHHNLILVDGAGPAMGTAGATNDAEGFIQNTFSNSRLSYGEVKTTYQGTEIIRKTLHVRNNYFLIADAVSSTSAHTYTWQLHGYGLEGGTAATGTFTDSLAAHEGIWQKNGIRLKAHVTATDGASGYVKATNGHELVYNTTENHTTMQVQKTGVAQTQFLSLLQPYTTTSATITTESSPQVAALASDEAEYQDLAFAQGDTISVTQIKLAEPVSSDARFTFFSLNKAGHFSQAFLEKGRELQYGSKVLLQSSQRVNSQWERQSDFAYTGYVSDATVLTLAMEAAHSSVTGDKVEFSRYDPIKKNLIVSLSGSSAFNVTLPVTTLPVKLTQFSAKRGRQQVELHWSTASEKQNAGFEVYRKTDSEPEFRKIGFVPGKGNCATASQYLFLDEAAPTETLYYQLKQVDEGGGFELSSVVAVKGSKAQKADISVFPVPSNEVVQVQCAGVAGQVEVRLLNSQGQLLHRQKFTGQTQISTQALAPGMYYLQVLDLNGKPVTGTKKVLVQH